MKEGICNYLLPNGEQCNRKTETYKYICDEHAEIQEIKPYGRYCEFCGIDTFNHDEHKEDCEDRE